MDVNKCLVDKESSYYLIIEVVNFLQFINFYRHIYDVYEKVAVKLYCIYWSYCSTVFHLCLEMRFSLMNIT